MKAWAAFYPYVLPHVIGCPNPTVDHALRNAAREFCLRSKAWEEPAEFEGDGASNRFDFDLPSQTELVQVARASVAGKDLDIFGADLLPPDWGTVPPCDGLYHLNDEEYLVFPVPPAGAQVSVTLSVRPGPFGPGVGDAVFVSHVEAIAAGALSRLLKMPRQPWTDLEQAAISLGQFESGAGDGANRAFMHTRPATRRVKTWGR